MKMIMALAGMGFVCYLIWPDLKKNYVDIRDVPEFNWRSPPKDQFIPGKNFGTPRRKGPAMPAQKPATAPTKRSASNGPEKDPIALIKKVSRQYNVPGGALYGIWSVESSRRLYGYGDSKDWPLVVDLIKPDGKCVQVYGQAKCDKHWRALKLICDQTRKDGTKVCDPNEVRASYALAMGPMQHMPGEIIDLSKGTPRWGDRAVDYDGDGVIDPHDLNDAMAMTAAFLKQYHSQLGTWQKAINRYYGSQTEGYMEGRTDGHKGVVDHWRVWCSSYENCDGGRQAVALND